MKTKSVLFLFLVLAALCARATVLFQDSLNYPYTDGSIEGQGQWYSFYPATPLQNAFVTNNVLLLTAVSTNDSVAAPTNGFTPPNPGSITYASFSLNVSQLPTGSGTYFAQLQDNNDSNDCCHVFITTAGTVVPGSYRLGIANFDTSYLTISPPVNFPMDLAPGITYNVVIIYDTDNNDPLAGATLMINPSYQDYQNALTDGENQIYTYFGQSYVFPGDTTSSSGQLNIVISQIGFSPYVYAGISNVIAGTTFTDVNTTNLPVIGIQPQPGTKYSGNSTVLYVAASGSDLTYQWHSTTYGTLSDGPNFTGSTSNVLTLNNLSASDSYYVIVTDTYGNTATSSNAVETVITTPTAPFFTAAPLTLTNNLFTSFGLTNLASGTGPLTYQWYFAPTNTPTTFAQLGGQTATSLIIPELEYPNAGNYYLQATGPDGVTAGPTNSLTVVAPQVATLPQLHELMGLVVTNITPSSTVPINTNGVSVSGYVSVFGPLTSTSKTYAEFYLTYSNYGIYVFFNPSGHTNQIPVPGSYVTVTGPCNVYHGQLEIDPNSTNNAQAVVISNTPSLQMPAPQLCNASNFNVLSTNSLTPYGIQVQCSLVTFTNVYFYASRTGSVVTFNGGKFYTNSTTSLYMTEGPYSFPNNTNSIEVYVPDYKGNDINGNGYTSTNLWGATIPTYAYQVTGILEYYSGIPGNELAVTRIQDFVTSAPASFTSSLTKTNASGVATVSWPAQSGSTYSVYGATNLNGPWNQTFGLSYFPSTGIFTDTNKAAAKFYKMSTP
jgi:hypothetical protein